MKRNEKIKLLQDISNGTQSMEKYKNQLFLSKVTTDELYHLITIQDRLKTDSATKEDELYFNQLLKTVKARN